MGVNINVEKTNLKIKRENFKNMVYAFRELSEKNKNFEDLKNIKSVKEILDFIGIPYCYNEIEDYYSIIDYTSEFHEIWDFEIALKTIAENLQENEEYELIINCYEYSEKTKYIFKNKELIIYHQSKEWIKKDKKMKELEILKQEKHSQNLTEYEKMNGYLD